MLVIKVGTLTDSLRFRLSEWGLATALMLWGVVLLLPYPSFSNPVYAHMESLMREERWGIVCFTIGAARLVILIVNGSWRITPHLRAVAAFLSSIVWFQVTLGLIAVGSYNTGLAIYPVCVVMDIICMFRSVAEARVNDEIARNGGT